MIFVIVFLKLATNHKVENTDQGSNSDLKSDSDFFRFYIMYLKSEFFESLKITLKLLQKSEIYDLARLFRIQIIFITTGFKIAYFMTSRFVLKKYK